MDGKVLTLLSHLRGKHRGDNRALLNEIALPSSMLATRRELGRKDNDINADFAPQHDSPIPGPARARGLSSAEFNSLSLSLLHA
jgi:hypothetical protein